MAVNMPPAEVEVSAELVSELIADQAPHLADLEVTPLAYGWDNFSFRVGPGLVARLPRRAMAVPLVEHESRWLPEIAPRLPLPVPAPEMVGEPGRGYPWPWTLVPWIPGEPAAASTGLDLSRCARDLGGFLLALHVPAPSAAPVNPFRGVDLAERDEATRERIGQLDGTIDTGAIIQLWDEALAIPPFTDEARWIHGDLHPANLLAVDDHLSGVIDFGDMTSGDPATDLAVGWMLFPGGLRRSFRQSCGEIDEATWARARGWALSLSLAYLANSADDSMLRGIGERTIERVLAGG